MTETILPDAARSGSGPVILHATCVALQGRGLLILGASGAGKSSLALRLLALGASLVSDDRCEIFRAETGTGGAEIRARCPSPAIRGKIEARGLGILTLPALDEVPLRLVIDLGAEETARLPQSRHIRLLGCDLPLVLRTRNAHLAEALLLWLSQEQDL